ncbi:hypothetical protein ACSDR0_46565 [Streptosporangium sp. G11]|uniref:hypothetical protein n=1 Tax=Streptosporangium sp. G11 TaxID=3436926 RepID=UPI003EBE4FA4
MSRLTSRSSGPAYGTAIRLRLMSRLVSSSERGTRPTPQSPSSDRNTRALFRSRAPAAAAFDTRIKSPWIPGSARRGVEKNLRGHGFAILTGSQSFYVSGTPGPLLEGETGRARQWGMALASARHTGAHRIT